MAQRDCYYSVSATTCTLALSCCLVIAATATDVRGTLTVYLLLLVLLLLVTINTTISSILMYQCLLQLNTNV